MWWCQTRSPGRAWPRPPKQRKTSRRPAEALQEEEEEEGTAGRRAACAMGWCSAPRWVLHGMQVLLYGCCQVQPGCNHIHNTLWWLKACVLTAERMQDAIGACLTLQPP